MDDEHYERQKSKTRLKRFLGISFGFNVVLLIVLLVSYLYQKYVFKAEEKKTEKPDSQIGIFTSEDVVCLECNHLGPNVRVEDTLYSNITYSSCGKRLCCIDDHSIAKFARKVVGKEENKTDSEDSLVWWRERPHAAHLYLTNKNQNNLVWTSTDKSGSAFSNLDHRENKVTVRKPGLYFVYSSISFIFNGVTAVPQVYYNISSFHPRYPRLPPFLVMGKYGGSPFSEKHHNGFLSGIVQLISGHEMSVFVNNHQFISNKPYANYFGVFKI